MEDDQYREYGSSERTNETPGYLRSMLMALSGARNGGPSSESDDEEQIQEVSAGPLVTSTSTPTEDAVPPNTSAEKVTDKEFMKDNSSDSSGRIPNSRPNLFHYGIPEAETFVRQTDFREGPTWSVGSLSRAASAFPDRMTFPHEESSGGGNYPGGQFSVRRSIGSIQNVTKRESKRSKDRPLDKEYRRISLPNSLAPHVHHRFPDATPAPEETVDYASHSRGNVQLIGRSAGGERGSFSGPNGLSPGRGAAGERGSFSGPNGLSPGRGAATGPDPDNEIYVIHLVFQGNSFPKKV
jgi:hypothetical protein